MTWLDVFIILLAVLPKLKMCTSLAWSGFANLSFAASQWPEHLIEPVPNYLGHDSTTWLRHSAIIVFTLYRVPTSLRDLNQILFLLWQIVQLHSRYTSCSAHINVQLPMLAECKSNRSFTTYPARRWVVCRYSLEPFGTVLNYIDAAFDE
jgi:hypothetical protein